MTCIHFLAYRELYDLLEEPTLYNIPLERGMRRSIQEQLAFSGVE